MDCDRPDDHTLLEHFQQGDRDALSMLYRAHYPAVYRFALYMTGDPDAAAEVVQETFLWLIHHPSAFDPGRGALPSFLCGLARKMLQRRDRVRRRFQPLSAAGGEDPHMVQAMDQEIETRNLREAIAALPEGYREAVILCGIESRTYEEAAAILDCAVGTVRSRLHRAKALLGQALGGATPAKLAATGRNTHE
jgi:RNA polymerase sigma-70 factor (ECF subfamily)